MAVVKSRNDARTKIMQAANLHMLRCHARRRYGFPVRLLNMRQIQQAVFTCRQNGLVSAELLDAAGFNTTRRR